MNTYDMSIVSAYHPIREDPFPYVSTGLFTSDLPTDDIFKDIKLEVTISPTQREFDTVHLR